jgi:Nuclease-related domain
MRIVKPIGKYSGEQAKKSLKKGLPILMSSYVFLLLTGLDYLPTYMILGKVTPVADFLAGITFMYGLMQFFIPYQHWRSGLSGERRVEKNLSDKLSDEYSMYNDILLKDGQRSGNIDHIVVGPTGIFVVETKNNQGAIIYDRYGWKGMGENKNPIFQVNKNMFRVKDVLKNCEVFTDKSLYLKSVVVFSNPKANLNITSEPDYGCIVHQIKSAADPSLADLIKNEPARFSDEEIEEIKQCLENSIGNWTTR